MIHYFSPINNIHRLLQSFENANFDIRIIMHIETLRIIFETNKTTPCTDKSVDVRVCHVPMLL